MRTIADYHHRRSDVKMECFNFPGSAAVARIDGTLTAAAAAVGAVDLPPPIAEEGVDVVDGGDKTLLGLVPGVAGAGADTAVDVVFVNLAAVIGALVGDNRPPYTIDVVVPIVEMLGVTTLPPVPTTLFFPAGPNFGVPGGDTLFLGIAREIDIGGVGVLLRAAAGGGGRIKTRF